MPSSLRLSDLPERSQDKLLARIAALGLNPVLWYGGPGLHGCSTEPPNSFHGEGVGWCYGTFLYRPDAELHGFCHEVGHVSQLSPERWHDLDADDPRTSEEVALIVQVELARGIRGLGVSVMLREMVQADYSLWGVGENGREVSGAYWWRATVPRRLRDALNKALAIAKRWKGWP